MSEMTPEWLREIAKMMEDDTGNWWGDDPDALRALASEWEGPHPTRDEIRGQIMDVVVETRGRWSLLQDDIESRVPMPEFDQMVADALIADCIARGWLRVSETESRGSSEVPAQ